jgi:methylmalonyl-CoA mutase N-terminal domain/subunit
VDAIDRIGGSQRAGEQQHRARRNRRSQLLHQDHAENRDQAVFGIEWNDLPDLTRSL